MIPDVVVPVATRLELFAATGIAPGTPRVLMKNFNCGVLSAL